MPARRTNPLHRGAGCSRRTAQGRCEAVKQPPFRDIFGVVRSRRTAARVPDTGSDLGTVRQVTQVPGHPNPSADRRGGVVHTPVGKRPGITTLAAAFATAAIAAAPFAATIERTAVAPVDDFAAQFHVDVDIGHNDRHVVAFPAFELCRREGFAAALSVTGRYRNRQGGLLRHKDGTVGGIGRHFERLDVGSSSPALGRGGGHREIDHGRRDESADRNPRNRGVGIVGKDDRQLRHHMVKEHPDRCRRWGNLFFHRDQQVGRCTSRRLVCSNGKLRGHSLFGVRMVGRERRFFIRIVIPQQIRGCKGRTVVGHQDILHVGFRTFGNAQPDAVAGIEMQSRNTGLDRRRDFHTRRTCVRL